MRAVVVVLVLLAACGGGDDPPTAATTTSTTAPASNDYVASIVTEHRMDLLHAIDVVQHECADDLRNCGTSLQVLHDDAEQLASSLTGVNAPANLAQLIDRTIRSAADASAMARTFDSECVPFGGTGCRSRLDATFRAVDPLRAVLNEWSPYL